MVKAKSRNGGRFSLPFSRGRMNESILRAAAATIGRAWQSYRGSSSSSRPRGGSMVAADGSGRRRAPGPPTANINGPRLGMVTHEGGNVTLSKTIYPQLARRQLSFGMQKISAPNHWLVNGTANLESSVGQQGIFQTQIATKNQLQSISAVLGPVNPPASRYLLESVDAETIFSNSACTSALLILYDYVVKRDLPNVSYLSGPDLTWYQGIDEEGGSATDANTVGSRPYESDMFNQYYKIVKTTRVNLSPGSTHRHVQQRVFNKVIHYSVNENLQFGMKDVTCGTIMVYHGQPAHDATTPTTISLSVAALDMVYKQSYTFRAIDDCQVSWSRSNNLPTSFPAGSQFVNEAVGQTQTSAGLAPGTLAS